jgi:hypothetical protein
MVSARQSRLRFFVVFRPCVLALALCLAVAPLGMSCCSSFPCSASQPKSDSDLPCHGSSGSHSHYPATAAPDLSACHAGELALEALRTEQDSRKIQEVCGHSADVDATSNSCASILCAFDSVPARTWGISPHLERQSSSYPPLRI